VDVFTTSVDGPADLDVRLDSAVEIDGVRVWYFRASAMRRLYLSPGMGHALRTRTRDFDLVHLHSVFLWPTWAAARAARSLGIPYVLSPRGMLVKDLIRRKSRWLKTAWIGLIERENLERAAAVHVTSSAEARALEEFGMRLRRVVEIPNGVDTPPQDIFRPGFSDSLPRTDVLHIGRVNWKKGLDRLIRAVALLPGVTLTLAGNDEEGYTEKLRRIAAEQGAADRVRFLPAIFDMEKWRLLRSARCFALPSHSENFGNAVLEAMAAGCPVIVTPEVGVSDVVRRSGAGLVVAGEPAALAAAIGHLLASPEKGAAMGRAGQKVAIDEYAWSQMASRFTQLYESIGSSRETSPC
jgi:glycosyltransferase involved in cell wall biosynthesis